jgi:fucose 4-O-acetylase-like acetyltransferase
MPPVSSPPRNASLDALRVLCLFGIVALHVAGGGFSDNKALGFLVDEVSRFAVPVFFLLSAHFWKEADLASPLQLAGKVARRVLPAFAAILAATIALRIVETGKPGFEVSPAGILLLAWTGGPAFHLWFLPALVLGSLLAGTLVRWLGLRGAVIATLALYVVGTSLGAYSKLWLGHGFPFWVDRNGLFFAPVFLVGGVLLRRHREAVSALPLIAIAASVAGFALLQMIEGYFVVGRFPMGHDYSLATLGYGFAVTVLFMRLTLRGGFWSTLGKATFGAYLIHLLVLGMLADFGLAGNSWAMVALGFSVSLGLALAARTVWQRVAAVRA